MGSLFQQSMHGVACTNGLRALRMQMTPAVLTGVDEAAAIEYAMPSYVERARDKRMPNQANERLAKT